MYPSTTVPNTAATADATNPSYQQRYGEVLLHLPVEPAKARHGALPPALQQLLVAHTDMV